MTGRIALVCAALAATPVAWAQQPFHAEPTGLWPGPMQGSTPNTLKGATVVDVSTLAALVADQRTVLVDVANVEHQPSGREAGLGWEPVHRTIPGAVWLPGAGTGHDVPGFADAFATRVAEATGGDKNRPVVTFCHPQRWGSWNAAKRLTELGYHHVYWYPGGGEGWEAQAPLRAVGEDKRWKATGFDKSSAADMPDDGTPAAH